METPEVLLVFNCQAADLAVLERVARRVGVAVRVAGSETEFAREAIARRPSSVVLGLSRDTLSSLDAISVIRAAHGDLPLIVVAEEDSLEVERRAREKGLFYYILRPVSRREISAVLRNLFRLIRK